MNMEHIPATGAVLDGRYRLVGAPTRQDLGLVFRAQDLHQEQPVEVLLLSPSWGQGVSALNRVEAAQQPVADLSGSGIVPFKGFGLLNGQLYLVRERSEGATLADLLAKSGRLATRDAVELTIRLCEVLNIAHKAGVVHGSLSPHAIRMDETENGRWAVSLLDAGLLPALSPTMVAQGRAWGRAPYLSPEQAAGKHAIIASDVYVLGSLLYEMLTGRPPFRSQDESVLAFQHVRQQPPSLQVLAPHVPQVLVQIVSQALAKEPSARYRNAGQLGHVLRTQARQTQPALRQQQSPAPQTPTHERLMVPPPPESSFEQDSSARQVFDVEGYESWAEEQAGIDWLMVGLLILAMVAVLGLIPLWRSVYRRYATPLPSTSFAPSERHDVALPWDPVRAQSGIVHQQCKGSAETSICCVPTSRSLSLGLPGRQQCHHDLKATGERHDTPLCQRLQLGTGHRSSEGLTQLSASTDLGVQLTCFERKV